MISAAALLVILLVRSRGMRPGAVAGRVLLFGALVALVGGIEWALDKTPVSNVLLYLLMAAACAGMAWTVISARQNPGKPCE